MPSPAHPPIGTLIDGNSLKLVEKLGTGGYGVVYRAVEVNSSNPRSFAVKCLPGSHDRRARRQPHMREIALHQLASAHPSIITLHRVVRNRHFTFLVMDYAPDGDLFGQILEEGTYLGRDFFIKCVFLQIIDAVAHCHSLGVYHRDIKPENVLCFDKGLRIAITDFGLATTDISSKEFKTGSVYHMSPECQGGNPLNGDDAYSPLHNDVWSLGIMLLNLTTGRNPWKSATLDDPTFRKYRRKPRHFLTTILPISDELNDVLIRALAVDWRKRISLSQFRGAIESITSFYSDQVVFDGNLAASIWESNLYVDDRNPLLDRPRESTTRTQITTLDGLVDEEEAERAYLDEGPNALLCHSPIHSTYKYSGRSSSSDSASPITPVSDYGERSQIYDFADREIYIPRSDEEVYQQFGAESKFMFPGSSFEDDDSSFASSVFHTPSNTTSTTVSKIAQKTHGDHFKTTKRYSSPNTSVYSIAESSYCLEDVALNEDERRWENEDGLASQPGQGSQPIAIPVRKSKAHIFDPMRFFPRSSGKSWLNRKVRHIL